MCTLTERRWLIVAFQTSCAAAGGLNCLPDVVADDEGRELVQHGSALFPIACYEEDLKSYSVAWHWHEEFEYILAVKGPLAVDVSKARLVLQTGQGVFVNSGVFHAVEQAETGDALLHSGVFHPRLIGGMDTIFWQKLVHPLLQPGAPAFFLLDEADDGQKAVLCHLREVWDAVAQEVFDYENQARYHLSAAVHLLGMQCEGGKTKVSQQEQIAARRMKQMLRFVEEHYAEELTVENVRKQGRFHPRCGTSFMFVLIIIATIVSSIVFSIIDITNPFLRMLAHLILLPLVVGISYEFNRYAGRSESLLSRALRWPGLMIQHLTVFEPDDSMIEVAIVAVEAVFDWKKYLEENFPEQYPDGYFEKEGRSGENAQEITA